jgi:hypothetical protein
VTIHRHCARTGTSLVLIARAAFRQQQRTHTLDMCAYEYTHVPRVTAVHAMTLLGARCDVLLAARVAISPSADDDRSVIGGADVELRMASAIAVDSATLDDAAIAAATHDAAAHEMARVVRTDDAAHRIEFGSAFAPGSVLVVRTSHDSAHAGE